MIIACVFYTVANYCLMPTRTMFLCYGTIKSDFNQSYFTINDFLQALTFFVIGGGVVAYDTIFFYFTLYIYIEFKMTKIAFKESKNQTFFHTVSNLLKQ